MSWLVYSLLAPIFWAFSNFIDKYSLEKNVTSIPDFLFFSSLFSWIALPLLVVVFGFPNISLLSLVPVGLGMMLLYSYGFYGKALELGDTSRLVILFKLIPVFTLALGFIFLGQSLNITQFLAFLLVLGGASIISFEHGEEKFKIHQGVFWILGAIAIWSVMFLGADWSLTKMSFGEFFVLDTLGGGLAGLSLLIVPRIRAQILHGLSLVTKSKCGWFALNDVFDILGQMAMKKALSIGPSAGLVTVAIQVQSLYAIALGIFLTLVLPQYFHEDISMKSIVGKVFGALIMFSGVYLLFVNT